MIDRLHDLGHYLARLGRNLGLFERMVAAVTLVALTYGLTLIGHGTYIKVKAQAAQILLDRAWERALDGEIEPRAWPWADTWPVAKVTLPRIGESAVVLAGANGEAMAFAPGYMAGTPRPGDSGTGIIAGHRDTHFAFLKDVIAGDSFNVVTADGETRHYTVTGTKIVHARSSGIDPYGPGKHLVLVTCFPFEARERGPLRYVVHAEEVRQVAGTNL